VKNNFRAALVFGLGLGLGLGCSVQMCATSWADNKAIAMDEMAGYLELVDCGSPTISPA
jgi:hypothetical protein